MAQENDFFFSFHIISFPMINFPIVSSLLAVLCNQTLKTRLCTLHCLSFPRFLSIADDGYMTIQKTPEVPSPSH